MTDPAVADTVHRLDGWRVGDLVVRTEASVRLVPAGTRGVVTSVTRYKIGVAWDVGEGVNTGTIARACGWRRK